MGIILVPRPGTLRYVDRPNPSGATLSENEATSNPGEDLGEPVEERDAGRGQPYLLLGGRIACVIGMILGVGGVWVTLAGSTPNTSGGALGGALGILGSFLGARRLATATVVLCVAAIFFALAASQGLIPA